MHVLVYNNMVYILNEWTTNIKQNKSKTYLTIYDNILHNTLHNHKVIINIAELYV